MTRGRLITIEGLDGAGKSTLAASLAATVRPVLDKHGIEIDMLREPGGVACSERVRALVKDPTLVVGARAEALLYAAARAQLVDERLRPRLEAGHWVLLDRFVDSSLAYQGAGRSLGIEEVRAINDFATSGLVPDRTLLLRIDPALGRGRQSRRGEAPDRLERESDAFFAEIGRAYDRLVEEEPDRIRVIDATRSRAEVAARALEAIDDLLPAGPARNGGPH